MKNTVLNPGKLSACFIFGLLTLPGLIQAQQLESPVACVEGSEPLALVYGDHTTNCMIDPVTDLDRFEFCGLAGDEVRINVYGPDFMDPDVEVRDNTAAIIAQDSCSNGCSLSIDLVLPADECYFIFVSDVGGNETGDYLLQLERIELPPLTAEHVNYDETKSDNIDPVVDIDFFTFYGSAGADIRLDAFGPDFMDPTVEIRDPSGVVVINGAADGASCNNGCSFSVDYLPAESGTYSLIVYDNGVNETGSYNFGITCLFGPCDSDGDGNPDPEAPLVSYDETIADTIESPVDVDPYQFNATMGTNLRLNVFGPDFMDPTVEIRDPFGLVVIDGVADGASCNNGCSFSVDFSPAVTGAYSLLVYDNGVNEVGSYNLSLGCLIGPCDSDADGTPDPAGPFVSYVTTTVDAVDTPVDIDFYTFNATVGTDLRLNVFGPDFMDPTVEIRDPSGALVIDGAADGASCNSGCSFSVDFSPSMSGTYSLIVYDALVNETGAYNLSLWCLFGPCDSDADGAVDGNPEVSVDTPVVLTYGVAANDAIAPPVDSDIFIFGGTAGDLIEINVAGPDFMDPTVEIRDPFGTVVINGVADGASCNSGCSFSFNLSPLATGTYSLMIYDNAVNENGAYEISVQCLIGSCNDAVAMCGDNCIDAANGPLIPDAGGNVQRDTNGDGYGNVCDPDLDGNNVVNFLDVSDWSDEFLSSDPDADLDGNGFVNFLDYFILTELFLEPPGPSCTLPAVP